MKEAKKPDFLSSFDGSGRAPRPIQRDALQWLQDNWNDSDIFGIAAPVGTGKSAIARAIQLATGANIVTPNNILLDQYRKDYPDLNYLKGIEHYKCPEVKKACSWKPLNDLPPCAACPFQTCKKGAIEGVPTVFNPMSLWFLKYSRNYKERSVTVLDESHLIESMLLTFTDKVFNQKRLAIPSDADHMVVFVGWLYAQWEELTGKMDGHKASGDLRKAAGYEKRAAVYELLLEELMDVPQNYALWWESTPRGRVLHLKPVFVSRHLLSKLFGKGKIVLLSGTLLKSDMVTLSGGQPFRYLEMPSSIPKENRVIQFTPTPFSLTYGSNTVDQLASTLDALCEKHKGVNIFIHVTYNMAHQLASLMKTPVITHTKADKAAKLALFLKYGGVMLASGMAEGVDLKGDLCRINIIPKIQYAFLGDNWVKKRKSLSDGSTWYSLQALKWLIQAAGRSTRGENDFSHTYILDPSFDGLVSRNRAHLPRYFVESIKWSI